MRHLDKKNRQEPKSFSTWKIHNKGSNWDDFSKSEPYKELKRELLVHQERLCCYCEIVIRENFDAHIEHLKDRYRHGGSTFEFNNLLAACQHNDSCGHFKGQKYFDKMVTPFDENCKHRFTYTGSGKMITVDENDIEGKQTINDVLNLNCNRLKDLRLSIIKTLESQDPELIKHCLDNCNDWNGFPSTFEYLLSKL